MGIMEGIPRDICQICMPHYLPALTCPDFIAYLQVVLLSCSLNLPASPSLGGHSECKASVLSVIVSKFHTVCVCWCVCATFALGAVQLTGWLRTHSLTKLTDWLTGRSPIFPHPQNRQRESDSDTDRPRRELAILSERQFKILINMPR